jgi:NADH-quinone oxidoreductase subunit L
LGWWLYGRKPLADTEETDVLERLWPDIFTLLKSKYFMDEIYEASVIRLNAWWAKFCDALDYWIWNGIVLLLSYGVLALSWFDRLFDEYVVNLGFDEGCRGLSEGAHLMSKFQNGRVQRYLRAIGVGLAVLVLLLIWGCRAS